MKITRKSPLTGTETTLDLPVTKDQLLAWQYGMLIQLAMPNLTADQREFVMTGCTPEDWARIFPPDAEEPTTMTTTIHANGSGNK